MAAISANRIALLSVRPEFAEAITTGVKRVEFRRVGFRHPVSHVVLYSTLPTGKVIGYFEVEGVTVDSPPNLWTRFGSVGGISHTRFREYFAGTTMGCAISVGLVQVLKRPLDLDALVGVSGPPQSFLYLRRESVRKVGALRNMLVPNT